MNDPDSLIALLSSGTLKFRTGILLVPEDLLHDQENLRVHYEADYIDCIPWVLDYITSNCQSDNLDITVDFIRQMLLKIAGDVTGNYDCVWVANIDTLIASLGDNEIQRFWDTLSSIQPTRGVLTSISRNATNLLSPQEKERWSKNHRIAIID